MAIPEDGGRLFPANGANWAELDSRLATPAHHYDCQGLTSPVVDSIGGKNLTWVPTVGGEVPSYQKPVPGYARKAIGKNASFNNPGEWRNLAMGSPSLNDNGSGAGTVLIFWVGRQFIVPAWGYPGGIGQVGLQFGSEFAYSSGAGGSGLPPGPTAGPSLTSFRAGGNIIASPHVRLDTANKYADGAMHAMLFQARELSADMVQTSLVTDLEDLSGQAGAVAPNQKQFNASAIDQFFLNPFTAFGGPVQFDHSDVWIWRSVPWLSLDEQVALLQSLRWRPPVTIRPSELYDPVPGSIGLIGRDVRPAREVGNG